MNATSSLQTDEQSQNRRVRMLALCVACLALLAFVPTVWMCGWIWDDDSYITLNRVVQSPDGLWRAWIPGATPQYYPLVFVSFWFEHALVDLHPALYHLDNALLHALGCACFYLVLSWLRVPHAFWIAAIVAVHPMQAESVAWVTERKNVLSFLFAAVSVLAWLRGEDSESTAHAVKWWSISLACFAAAMLSKTTAVFVPPALILIRLWARRPIDSAFFVRVAPYFVLGAIGGLHTAYLEKTLVGAVGEEFALTFLQRLGLIAQNFIFYPLHALVPTEQVFIMPRWRLGEEFFGLDAVSLVALALSIAIVSAVLVAWRRNRAPLLILLWYGAAIFPALGFFDIYPFRYSFVADHFAYAAIPAIVCAVVSLITQWVVGSRTQHAIFTAVIALLLLQCWRTLERFSDEKTLWTITAAQNSEAWIARDNLSAIALREAEEVLNLPSSELAGEQAARAEFVRERAEDALWLSNHPASERHDPSVSRVNRSEAYRLLGNFDHALVELDELERVYSEPRGALGRCEMTAEWHWLRGRLLEQLLRDDEAQVEFRLAARDERSGVRETALRSLLALAARKSDIPEALVAARALVEVAPGDREARLNLGGLLIASGAQGEGRRILLVQLMSRELTESLWIAAAIRYVRSVGDDVSCSQDEIDTAHRFADSMVERSGGSDLAKLLLARMRLRTGDQTGARALAVEVENRSKSEVAVAEAKAIRALADQ